MLKLIINQTNWGIIGTLFGFIIGFFVKIYLIDIVGISQWGKYVSAHAFATAFDTILSIGIPFIILKFIPNYIQKNRDLAKFLIYKILKYAVYVSFIFIISIYYFSSFIDKYIYTEIDDFSFIILLASIHTPIAIFTGIITSLYRSVLKIKTLMLYSVFFVVSLRALLTLIIFQFTSNIIYFICIELCVCTLSLIILVYLFNKNEMTILRIKNQKNILEPSLYIYAKNIYANSLATFFGNQSLAIIISILLSPNDIGIYSILITLTGISLFLIQNLNKIFAPIISKLYSANMIEELALMYKKTTFIINFITIPFLILIIYFSEEILMLYDSDGEILYYLPYLYILMAARLISLFAGSSGTFMVMAGLEKQELIIQIFKALIVSLLAILFVKEYGLFLVILIFTISSFIVNLFQLFFINKVIGINPFSRNLVLLLLLSLPIYYYAMYHDNEFRLYQIVLYPIFIYVFYFIVFFKSIKSFYLELKND